MTTGAATSVPGQLLSAIKARKFTQAARLFSSDCDFKAWTNVGYWAATEPSTVAKIFEVWFSPGAGSVVVDSHEVAAGKGLHILEFEIAWKTLPDEQPRVLREVYLLTIKPDKVTKTDKITEARIYCAGLHTDFPEVDLEKQRRAKGLGGAKISNSPRVVAAKAS